MAEITKGWDLLNYKPGHVAHDWTEDGVRCLVLRGPHSWNAYFGVPVDHPAAGFDYDDLAVRCHGGLTYSGKGLKGAPENYYFYGFDYGHSGDKSAYDSELKYSFGGKEWTADQVKADMWDALYDFKKFVRLCEKIKTK